MRSWTRHLTAFLAVATLAAACGGAGGGQPAATGGTPDRCGIPATAKCATEAQALSGAGATFSVTLPRAG